MKNHIEISISCTDCIRRSTPDCADCLVSFVVGGTPEVLEITESEAEAIQLFTAQGMMPRLKFHQRVAD